MDWIFTKPQVVKNKFPWVTSGKSYQSLFLFGEELTFLYWIWNINFQHVGNWYSLIFFPHSLRQIQFTTHGKLIEHNFNPPIVGNHTSVGNFISFQFPKCLESSIKWWKIWYNFACNIVERTYCATEEKCFGNNCHFFYS